MMFIDHTDGAQVGFAIANPSGTRPATVTMQFLGEDGVTMLDSAQVQLGPRSQMARYVNEVFPGMLTGIVGSLRINSPSAVCGMGLRMRGENLSEDPMFVIN